jgi:hypothetical protein
MMTVSEAGWTMAEARVAELESAQDRAWRRYKAAKDVVARGDLNGQIGRTWEADAAVLDEITKPETGQ